MTNRAVSNSCCWAGVCAGVSMQITASDFAAVRLPAFRILLLLLYLLFTSSGAPAVASSAISRY